MQTVLIPAQAQQLSTSPNFTGQQLQLATRSAFLHTCCMQVVITGPSRILSAYCRQQRLPAPGDCCVLQLLKRLLLKSSPCIRQLQIISEMWSVWF